MSITIVAAVDCKFGLAKDGVIPWHSKEDFKWFKELTTRKDDQGRFPVVIMGNTTWKTLPKKPLVDRVNIVLTKSDNLNKDFCLYYNSFEKAIEYARSITDKIFIIGGSSIYKIALESGLINDVYITKFLEDYECNVFFPNKILINSFKLDEIETKFDGKITVYHYFQKRS